MKTHSNADHKLDMRTFNLVSTLLAIVNTNDDSDSDVFLARALLENFDCLNEMSIYDLADECFVSRSSLQRFIKQIGFDSFANLKASIAQVKEHNQRFSRYASVENFSLSYHKQMEDMMSSIEDLANSVHMDYFVDLIHNAKRVVICYAAFSTIAPVQFQEAMISNGKVIRCMTNSSKSIDFLNSLDECDLLITLSVTGNYAYATLKDVENVKAFKVLFTMNHLQKFQNYYDRIIYLSNNEESYDYIRDAVRDAYTIQGFSYLFDLILNKYLIKYDSK